MNILTLLNIETYSLMAKEIHKKAMVSEQHFCTIDASSGICTAKLPRNCIPGAPAPVAAAARQWQIAVGLSLAAPDTGMNNGGSH